MLKKVSLIFVVVGITLRRWSNALDQFFNGSSAGVVALAPISLDFSEQVQVLCLRGKHLNTDNIQSDHEALSRLYFLDKGPPDDNEDISTENHHRQHLERTEETFEIQSTSHFEDYCSRVLYVIERLLSEKPVQNYTISGSILVSCYVWPERYTSSTVIRKFHFELSWDHSPCYLFYICYLCQGFNRRVLVWCWTSVWYLVICWIEYQWL